MPLIDPHILASAARRLSGPDRGNLTRIAVELGAGPADRFDLGWRLRLEFEELERIGGWLRMADDNHRMVIGLCHAPLEQPAAARKPRQGALFDEAEFVPPPPSGNGRSSIKGAVIDEAIRIMVPAGVPESRVRSFVGKLFSTHDIGPVAQAVYELSRVDVVPDPVAWIQGCLRRRKNAPAKDGLPAKARRDAAGPVTAPARPLATPGFLGISPGLAAQIQARNSNLQLEIKAS